MGGGARPASKPPGGMGGWGLAAGACSQEPLAQFPGSPALPQDSCSGCARISGPGVGGGLLEAGEQFPLFPPIRASCLCAAAFNSMDEEAHLSPVCEAQVSGPCPLARCRRRRRGGVPSGLSLCRWAQIVSCLMPTPVKAPGI